MKDILENIVLVFALILCALLLLGGIVVISNNTYGSLQLRSFNKINNTSYTIEEWRIYQYDIKELHPFKEQKAE